MGVYVVFCWLSPPNTYTWQFLLKPMGVGYLLPMGLNTSKRTCHEIQLAPYFVLLRGVWPLARRRVAKQSCTGASVLTRNRIREARPASAWMTSLSGRSTGSSCHRRRAASRHAAAHRPGRHRFAASHPHPLRCQPPSPPRCQPPSPPRCQPPSQLPPPRCQSPWPPFAPRQRFPAAPAPLP